MSTQLQPYTGNYGSTYYQTGAYPPPPPPYNTRRNAWWRGFLIASVIHWIIILLLLWLWTSYQESSTVTQAKFCLVVDKDPIIHEIQLPSNCEPKPQPKIRKPQPRRPKVTEIRQAPPRVAPPPPRTVNLPTPKQKPTSLVEEQDRVVQSYLNKLIARIKASRKYPPTALARQQEGEVLVGFNIVRDGTMDNIRVLRSSGYPILDRDAVKSLTKISPFEPIPQEMIDALGRDTFSFQIPIEYYIER